MTPQIAQLMAEYNRWMNVIELRRYRQRLDGLIFQAGVDVGVTDLLAVIPRRDA